jgi:hypothetical protein
MLWTGPIALLWALADDFAVQVAEKSRQRALDAIGARAQEIYRRFQVLLDQSYDRRLDKWIDLTDRQRKALLEDLSAHLGADVIGAGHSRVVIRVRPDSHPGFVLKLAFSAQGRAGNGTEASVWRWAVDKADVNSRARTLSEHLVPALLMANDSNWLVMPLAGDLPLELRWQLEDQEAGAAAGRLGWKLHKSGARDLHVGNYGMHEGQPKLLDYGYVDREVARQAWVHFSQVRHEAELLAERAQLGVADDESKYGRLWREV